ncbi:MAG: EFR1 family ferrodoxin [bacterium]|nr:EFR1 family ferrodoxin [bacterium]
MVYAGTRVQFPPPPHPQSGCGCSERNVHPQFRFFILSPGMGFRTREVSMPRACIVYFSQSGSTEKVAKGIARGLRKAGYRIDAFNLFPAGPFPDVRGYDLIGIGLPVYYFRPPLNVLDFIRQLPPLKNVPAFIFVTKGSNIGSAGNRIRRILKAKGAREAGYFSCWGADHFLLYLQKGYFLFPGHPDKKELKKAESFGCETARNVKNKKYQTFPSDPPVRGFALFLAWFFTVNFFLRLVYHRFFFVKRKKCSSCGVCVKACPKQNIVLNRRGFPKWGMRCILCCYCEMKCPKEAILSVMNFPAFNLLVKNFCLPATLKNPAIRYKKVVFRPGGAVRG